MLETPQAGQPGIRDPAVVEVEFLDLPQTFDRPERGVVHLRAAEGDDIEIAIVTLGDVAAEPVRGGIGVFATRMIPSGDRWKP